MVRLSVFLTLFMLVTFVSCEKCKKCTYSYTQTVIVQTVNGEEEKVLEFNDVQLTLGDEILDAECVKGDKKFTIEDHYITKGDTTVLDNYQYSCIDL